MVLVVIQVEIIDDQSCWRGNILQYSLAQFDQLFPTIEEFAGCQLMSDLGLVQLVAEILRNQLV